MIRINLAARKQAAIVGGGGGGEGRNFGGLKVPMGLSRMSLDMDQLKELPIRKFVLPIIAAFALSYYLDGLKEDEMHRLEEIMGKLNAERAQLQAAVGKIKGYEARKAEVESEEQTLRNKIDTIQKLIAERANPPKLLRALSTAIPKDVWLSELKAGDQEIDLKGFTLSMDQVSDFMKNLGESAYFAEASLRDSKQTKDEAGLDVASFEVSTKRR